MHVAENHYAGAHNRRLNFEEVFLQTYLSCCVHLMRVYLPALGAVMLA